MPRTNRNTANAEYEVIVRHSWDDPETGEHTRFQVGDDYTGGDVDGCLKGYDHNGPLIRKKRRPTAPAESPEEN